MKSLKSIILTSIISLTILSSVIFLLVAMTFSNKALRGVFTTDVEEMIQIVSNVVDDENKLRLDLITDLSALPFIRDSNTSLIEKQKQLQEIAKKDESFLEISIVDYFGMSEDVDGNSIFIGRREDFLKARDGAPAVYGPVFNENNKLVTYYSVPVFNGNNEIKSIMSLTTDGKILSDICNNYKLGGTTHPFIVDRTQIDIYAHSDYEIVQKRQNYRQESKDPKYTGLLELVNSLDKSESGIYTFKEGKEDIYFAYCAIKDTNLTVVACIPRDELDNRTKGMRFNMIIVSVILFIIGLSIALFLGRATNPLKVLGNLIIGIGSGNADLTSRLELKHVKKEIGDVVKGFNNFVGKLQEIVSSIRESENLLSEANKELQLCSEETATSISQILVNIQGVASEIGSETKSVSETASAVHQIASNINSLENMIAKQSENVEEATAAVEEMVGNINSVNRSVAGMVEAFVDLEKNAKLGIETQANVNDRLQKINEESQMLLEANAVISAIAEQTNLLAMNAAIEAAHAGEAGKGFSVVADEIRKLSENSSAQSESIGQELSSVQASINYVVMESNKAAEAFNSVALNIKKTDEVIQLIKNAMEEQQVGSKQITESLYAMNNSTSEVRLAAKEMAEGNGQILTEVQILQNATGNVNNSINQMVDGVQNIKDSGTRLTKIAKDVSTSVETIHSEIGQFKV